MTADRTWPISPACIQGWIGCLTLFILAVQPSYSQQPAPPDLETIEEVCLGSINPTTGACESPALLENPAEQGITTLGSRFVTARGVCTLEDAALMRHLYAYSPSWVLTDDDPIAYNGSECHVGDITIHDGFIFAPLSDFVPAWKDPIGGGGASVYQIARFHPDTLDDAGDWGVTQTLQANGINGDLAGLASYGGDLWAIEWQEAAAAQNAHIFQLDADGQNSPTVLQTYKISTKLANGIEFDPPFIYISQGDDPNRGTIDVYELATLSTSAVNTPTQSLTYDVSGWLGSTVQGAHAEGLTLRGAELWVCAAAGDIVRRIQRPAGRIWYVDAGASGSADGRTWDDAFNDLQNALDAATSGDEIWVAAATYVPSDETQPGDPRSSTFALKPGVRLYGGFAGTEHRRLDRYTDSRANQERVRDVRCREENQTILSGALPGGQRVYHVVSAECPDDGSTPVDCIDSSTVLDGFTVRDGLADTVGDGRARGGGVFIRRASPTVSSCRVTQNNGLVGGGMGIGAAAILCWSTASLSTMSQTSRAAGSTRARAPRASSTRGFSPTRRETRAVESTSRTPTPEERRPRWSVASSAATRQASKFR